MRDRQYGADVAGETPKVRPTIMMANGLLLLFVATLQLCGSLLMVISLIPGADIRTIHMNAATTFYVLSILVPLIFYWRRHPGATDAMRMVRPRTKHVVLAALAVPLGLLLSARIALLWGIGIESMGWKISQSTLFIGKGPMGAFIAFIGIAFVPAVCEELLCRGVLLSAYERNGSVRALLLVSLLFALMHASVGGFLVHFLLGLVLGFLAVSTGSIVVPMVYHFFHNTLIVMLTLAMSDAQLAQASEVTSLYQVAGGTAGMLKMLIEVLVMLVFYGLLMLAISSDRERSGRPFGIARPARTTPSSWKEQIVLLSAVVTMGVQMIWAILYAAGVI